MTNLKFFITQSQPITTLNQKNTKKIKNLKNISIWASGNGSNAENIIKYFNNHKKIRIDHIICNNSKAGVIECAQRLNIDCFVFSKKDFNEGNAVLNKIIERKTNYIILSGFLQMVPTNIINKFPNAIINIHPALLPDFGGKGMYGNHVHEAVINAKKMNLVLLFILLMKFMIMEK